MIINNLNDLKNKKIHFIGIGGISMSALAQMLKKDKFDVQGSDLCENDEVKKLRKKGIKVYNKHLEDNLKYVDVVVYTSAIHEDNEELIYAKNNKLTILKRAELLGLISSNYKNVIAITGSHGKTTTTAMISEMFIKAGLKPTVHIGGKDNYIGSNYKVGNKNFFITEACEYMDNYLYLKPNVGVILNVDGDHLDYFKCTENVISSFEKFANLTKGKGVIFSCLDDANSENFSNYENNTTFGIESKKAELKANNIKEYSPGKYSFVAQFYGYPLGKIKLNIFGKHNIYNALATILVGICFDIDFSVIKESIENFAGVERRTQYIGQINGANIFHDYAHHPKQIEKMIELAKCLTRNSDSKVITIFEPHTYSRTKFLLNDFAISLSKSDVVMLAPVYSAREDISEGLTSLELLKMIEKTNKNSYIFDGFDDILSAINEQAKKGDLVLILGAGTIETLAKMIKK